ncbi:hypothetical protein AaE_009703 [Aphanomyces astaci]|uniref:C2H2-type domain-containing protein n=1 Tax=Aphanomyces astaci TaxID=112090 RepID=A0A6A4ZRT5_APHAT|nr:hypothetical protein AaE_009703 [Aphanomyces astaci]
MEHVLVTADENGEYLCPQCEVKYTRQESLRMHCTRKHGLAITFKVKRTAAEKSEQSRQRKAKWSEKQAAIRALVSLSTVEEKRDAFSRRDARKRGVHEAKDPIVYTKIFDDVVTAYDGQLVPDAPTNHLYALQITGASKPMWIDGLRELERGKGIGSFVNRASREHHCYMNCDYKEFAESAYIVITKKIKANSELFTVYSRGYRF